MTRPEDCPTCHDEVWFVDWVNGQGEIAYDDPDFAEEHNCKENPDARHDAHASASSA